MSSDSDVPLHDGYYHGWWINRLRLELNVNKLMFIGHDPFRWVIPVNMRGCEYPAIPKSAARHLPPEQTCETLPDNAAGH